MYASAHARAPLWTTGEARTIADEPLVQARKLMEPQLGLLYLGAKSLVLLDLAYMSAFDMQVRQ